MLETDVLTPLLHHLVVALIESIKIQDGQLIYLSDEQQIDVFDRSMSYVGFEI